MNKDNYDIIIKWRATCWKRVKSGVDLSTANKYVTQKITDKYVSALKGPYRIVPTGANTGPDGRVIIDHDDGDMPESREFDTVKGYLND